MIKISFFFAFLFWGCNNINAPPKILIFIVVDQATPEILQKYNQLFTGGYRWLLDNGIHYTNTDHDYAYTTTGPGHFVLSSGMFPGPAGVIGNNWYDRDLKREWYCVEDTISINLTGPQEGRSYRLVNSSTIGDWLKINNPNSKVVSIAGKDRAAILLAGKNPDLVLWYDKNGSYTSSTYYLPNLPRWVKSFNDTLNVISYLDSTWSHLMSQRIYENNTRKDSFRGESSWSREGSKNINLPIELKNLGQKALLRNFYETPYGDKSLFNLAREAIKNQNLGVDTDLDILFLGLSATDGIGHSFGPNSVEQLDNYLRLDRSLGIFIDELENKFGKGNILYSLTSDHGVLDLPERLLSKGFDSGRINRAMKKNIYSSTIKKIDKKIGKNKVIDHGNFFYFKEDILTVEKNIAIKIIKNSLENLPGIGMVLSKDEILSGGQSSLDKRLRNMVHLNRSPDVYVILDKYWTWTTVGTSHGSPYRYDTHIPFIVSRSGFNGKINDTQLSSVDIAPSLANYLNIKYPKTLNGKPININE